MRTHIARFADDPAAPGEGSAAPDLPVALATRWMGGSGAAFSQLAIDPQKSDTTQK